MNELLQWKEKAEEKKQLQSRLKKAQEDLQKLQEKLEMLKAELQKEFKDVQQLEEGGITALFYSILGSKVEKLDKERQEYLAAKLKYDNCKNELEQLQEEIYRIEKQIFELGDPESTYVSLLDKKSLKLRESGDNNFLQYEKLLETHFAQKKEINEAIEAGEMALQGLRNAIKSLKSALGWGVYDMAGGGLIATAVKHSKIDESKNIIQDVQVWLSRFRRELSDVQIDTGENLSVQMDSFSTFADYFFDNLIFDWVVQSKINRSLEGCETIYKQVLDIVTQLRINDVDVTQKYKETNADFTGYIEKVKI